jgi:hypothetical protein
MLEMIETMTGIKSKYGHRWKTGADMGRDVMTELGIEWDEPEEEPPSTNFLLYPALLILAISLIYVIFRDSFHMVLVNYRMKRLHRTQHTSFASIVLQEFVVRLPELDRLFTLWQTWARDVLMQMRDSSSAEKITMMPPPAVASRKDSTAPAQSSLTTTMNNSSSSNNNSNHIRRRRAVKKRS